MAPTPPGAPDPYTDPNELFDVYRADGTPAGRVKRRADVHRDGDWHRSFHCWVLCQPPHPPAPPPASRAPAPLGERGSTSYRGLRPRTPSRPRSPHGSLLLLQRRGYGKDTWPGYLDASVGGHYRAGETLADVVREVEEEIGQAARLEDLIPLGHRVAVGEPDQGTRDREIQDVFLWRPALPLDAFRPQPVEVAELAGVAVPDLLRLFAGQAPSVPATRLDSERRITAGAVTAAEFVVTVDRYFYRVAALADLALRGYPHLVV